MSDWFIPMFMTFEAHIPNADVYVAAMSLPMIDKLFFVDKVQASVFLDYGCGDGAMLAHMADFMPDAVLIGYDESEDMISRARGACQPAGIPDVGLACGP